MLDRAYWYDMPDPDTLAKIDKLAKALPELPPLRCTCGTARLVLRPSDFSSSSRPSTVEGPAAD